MARLPYVLPCLLLAACKFGDDRPLGGEPVDASLDAPVPGTRHVLLTEVRSNGTTDEFIELWNPSNKDIDLSNYYLTDLVEYWKYPTGTQASAMADFLVRFPAGAIIASDEVITVAINHNDFRSSFPAVVPTYSVDLVADNASGSKAFRTRLINGTQAPSITDSGEYIVLFYWNGMSDTVQDVDSIVTGTVAGVSAFNSRVNKSAVDGPDSGNEPTAYKPEDGAYGGGMAMTIAGTTPSSSYKRKAHELGSESQAGMSNGIFGDDETSEQLRQTWDGAAGYSAPTPGALVRF